MINKISYESLGHVNHGWLEARHHFSFGSYQDPNRTGFGDLVVINDDLIAAQSGFATHGHDNMEIITYVRQGAITHEDSLGNKGKTNAGDVQVMSAGTGVKHSEHNLEDETTSLYQIWIKPNALNVEPRWDAMEFPKEHVENRLNLIVGGSDEAPLFIHANADIYAGKIKAKKELNHKLKRSGYVLASFGAFEVNGIKLKKGDALEITDAEELKITTHEESELLVIDV